MTRKQKIEYKIASYDRLTSYGFRVVPCVPREKKPLAKWKRFRWSIPNRQEMINWIRRHPECNFALVMGKEPGFIAIDIDNDFAIEYFKSLGDFGNAVAVKTCDGWHYIFKYPTNLPVDETVLNIIRVFRDDPEKQHIKIDVFSDGGYIMAAGSIHPDGPVYEFVVSPEGNGGISNAPEWLIDWILNVSNVIKKKESCIMK